MHEYEIIYIATTPIYTFAMYKLLHAFFEERVYNKRIEVCSYFVYMLILSITIFITRVPLLMLIFNLLSLFLISFNYQSSMQRRIIYISLTYSVMLLIELLISAAIGFLDFSAFENSSFQSIIGIITIRIVMMIVAYLIYKYQNSKKKDFIIPTVYYLAFTTILFGTLYLFIASLDNNDISIRSLLLRAAILLVVNTTMMIIDEKIYDSAIVINEKNILKQQNIAYENQAELISQSDESIKTLRHDIKNHLIVLNEMYKNDKINALDIYIKKILDEIEGGDFSKSNNFVIDSIINFKLRKLQATDTKISINVVAPQTINILAYDLTVILGNLLDNAITAILQSKNKKLDLRISCSMGNLIILIDNSFDGKLIIENRRFKTKKSAKTNHGIGLASVEMSLKNYGGEIRTAYTNDTFSVAIIIPYDS